MEVLNFMNTHDDWEEILTQPPYCIKVNRDDKYILLKYNQLSSDFTLPIVRECRGSIFYLNDNGKYECVARAFDKFGNWGESYVKDIDWDSAVVEEKIDGCFSGQDCVMLADGTKKMIKEIVNQKLCCEVLSYNFNTQKVEAKKVIGWNKSRHTRPLSDWLTIHLDGVRSTLYGCISQHNIITPTKNHIFFRKNTDLMEEVMASELQENDIIYTPIFSLTNVERQVALGTLLGDGSLTYLNSNNYCGIRFTHSVKQYEYVNFKANLLNKIGGKVKNIHVENSYGKDKTRYMGHVHPEYSEIYKLIYDNVTKKKKITCQFLEKLDWLGFAIWYMDDGSLQAGSKNNSIHLHTEGFSQEDVIMISTFYNNKGYKNYIQTYRGYYIINFSTEASEMIWQNIRMYIPNVMQYKLPNRHQGFYQEIFDDGIREIILVEKTIKKIEDGLNAHNLYHTKSCYSYDIEVEDNHNYFCQGVLVHNSLIKLWHHDDEWHISTNGTIDAFKAQIGDTELTFGDLVNEAIGYSDIPYFLETLDTNETYMFELVSPLSKVTIYYPQTKLYYLGQRNMSTMVESKNYTEHMREYGILCPKVYSLNDLNSCLKYVQTMSKDEEGFVIRDKNFNRMKLKSPEYLLASHMRNNGIITVKRVIEMIKHDMLDDFIAYCPEYRKFAEDVVEDITCTYIQLEIDWLLASVFAHLPRKEFAEHIKSRENQEFLWIKYDHPKTVAQEYLMNKPTNKIKEMIEQYKRRRGDNNELSQ